MAKKLSVFTLYKLCAFPVRMCISGESHHNSGEDVYSIVIHPHQEWGCASPGMHILTGNAQSFI